MAKNENIDISVIIPVYNAGVLIDRCLNSVFSQKGNYSIEVIVVDDGSTDNSVELIRRRPEQDKIRLFRQSNSGPSKARNKGISVARGKYLAFLDADDYWMPDFIISTTSFLDLHQECVAVSVAQKHISLEGIGEKPKEWNSITNGQEKVIDDFYYFWNQHNHICTGSILLRTHVIKEIGGLREDLRSIEDIELWAMVGSKGKFGYIPKLLFVSDGRKVTFSLGWSKYKARFRSTVDFETWFKRLATTMTPFQQESNSKNFNKVVLGITRSFICGGKFKEARKNLSYYRLNGNNSHYIINIEKKGTCIWYLFCFLYLGYRYLKINLPFWKNKILKWRE